MDEREFHVLVKHNFLMNNNTVDTKKWLDEYYPDTAPDDVTICSYFAKFNRDDEEIDKREFRVLMKHNFLIKKTVPDTKKWLDECYPGSAPGETTVRKWFAKFRKGRMRTEDDERSGRPKEAVTDENIKKIQKMMTDDPKLRLTDIAGTLKISKERVGHIVHEHVDTRMLCYKMVTSEPTIDQRQQKMDEYDEGWELYNNRYVTWDATWIDHINTESSCQSGEPNPKLAKTPQSKGQVMASIFWDAHGVIFIDYHEKGKTINTDYYIGLLKRFKNEIAVKRPHLKRRKVLFHQGKPVKKPTKSHESILHPPHSSDQAFGELFMFSELNTMLAGKKISYNEDIIAQIEAYLDAKDMLHYENGIDNSEVSIIGE